MNHQRNICVFKEYHRYEQSRCVFIFTKKSLSVLTGIKRIVLKLNVLKEGLQSAFRVCICLNHFLNSVMKKSSFRDNDVFSFIRFCYDDIRISSRRFLKT